MTTGRLVVLDDRALYLIRNAHRLGIMAVNNLRSSDSLSAKFAKVLLILKIKLLNLIRGTKYSD